MSRSSAAAGHRAPAAAFRMSGRARQVAVFAVVGTANTDVFLVLFTISDWAGLHTLSRSRT